MDIIKIKKNLEDNNQTHLLRFADSLSEAEKEKLFNQIKAINWSELNELIESHVKTHPEIDIPDDIQPAPFWPLMPKTEEQKKYYKKAIEKGKKLIQSGRLALLTVAGGQGTRLGFNGPKGTFPVTPVKSKTLFQYFSESILRLNEKYNCELSWYIMTSYLNRDATEEFFKENNFFGLKEDKVTFFVQGTMPAVDFSGKLLLGAKNSLALSPNGHGGIFRAVKDTGVLKMMRDRNEDFISYFQVDNPLVTLADPLFIGLHALENSEMSARMLPKNGPEEKLGNFCMVNGKLTIIEYSDMPDKLAKAVNPDGTLRFLAGSPAIHIITRPFMEKLTSHENFKLPWHRAEKKVKYIDENGNLIKPDKPNAVKLEMFIFDALTVAEKTMILEARRESEFAPVKNATGNDSPESCRAMLIARDAERMKKAGMEIPFNTNGNPDCIIEVSPKIIIDDEDAKSYVEKNKHAATLISVKSGDKIYVES